MPTLEITTMVGCPLMCTFCPQDKLKREYGDGEKYLSLANFDMMLSKVPSHVQIDFSGMSEPWANPSATDMLEMTLKRGYFAVVYSTLYGISVSEAERIIDLLVEHRSQVKAVVIHLPDARGNMRGFRHSSEYDAVLDVFVQAKDRLSYLGLMTMDSGDVPDPAIKAMPTLPWAGNRRAGSLDIAAIGGQLVETLADHLTPVSCSYTPFYDHNVVLPNGDVVLCCMDYSLKHKVGNLLTSDYYSIFSSPGMGRLRAENAKLGRSDTICKNCRRANTYFLSEKDHQFWGKVEGED